MTKFQGVVNLDIRDSVPDWAPFDAPRATGLCVGRDSREPVTDDYARPHPHVLTGRTINRVAVDVSGEPYVDLEREAVAMMPRE
jgi:hypothetical protein